MRVIAGQFRSRKIKGPRGLEMRPTSDRLRETLFSILGNRVSDSAFVDVCAGTGAVGLEALSRGAKEVVFIDDAAPSIRLIRENLSACGVMDRCELMQCDALSGLRLLARRGYRCDVLFMDPPYQWHDYSRVLDAIFLAPLVGSASLVIVEHHHKARIPEAGASYLRTRLVRQGDHCLSFYAASLPA